MMRHVLAHPVLEEALTATERIIGANLSTTQWSHELSSQISTALTLLASHPDWVPAHFPRLDTLFAHWLQRSAQLSGSDRPDVMGGQAASIIDSLGRAISKGTLVLSDPAIERLLLWVGEWPSDQKQAIADRLAELSQRFPSEVWTLADREPNKQERPWDTVLTSYRKGRTVEGVILERTKGGFNVDIGVKAFLPGSQVDLNTPRNLDSLLGTQASFEIIKLDEILRNVVVSRRSILERAREELRKKTVASLAIDALVNGKVKNITDYGAFIDIGGIDGLLHISDMSPRPTHPSKLFAIGDEVRVVVLKYDAATARVSLGFTHDPQESGDSSNS